MKRICLALAVCALAAGPAAAAPPPFTPPAGQPTGTPLPIPAQAAVPDAVVAAHPNGHVLQPLRVERIDPGQARALFARNPGEDLKQAPTARRVTRSFASGCWRVYYAQSDDSAWGLGQAEEHVNPLWCGNGSQMGGVDNGWHYEVCSGFVSCNGEAGPYLGIGCPLYCWEAGYDLYGHFVVYLWYENFQENIAYELSPAGPGNSWAYGWEVT